MNNGNKVNFAAYINDIEFLKKKERARSLIISIFHAIHFSPISMGNETLDQTKLEIEKRIAHGIFFEHYFAFKIPKSNIPHLDVESFMTSSTAQKEIILDKYLRNNFNLFLKRVRYHFRHDLFNLEFINLLLDYSDSRDLHTETIDNRFQSNGLYLIINFLNELSLQLSHDEYLEAILSKHDSYSRLLLQNYLQNIILNKSNVEVLNSFPKDLIEREKDNIGKSFRSSVETHSNIYLEEPLKHDILIIYFVLRLLHQEFPGLYKTKILEFLKDENKSVMLFQCSLKSVIENGVITYYAFDENSLLPELTIEQLNNTLCNSVIDKIDDKLKDFFLIYTKQKELGFKPDQYFSRDLKQWRR